ncbi:3-demethylubiquinone-9 3-O-methyltransferase [Pyrenochaeta sp. DS3sAY3a]|nr:3-demethylubiquinone-9 3-O-methyltransferase [Pyrenochaeta sp. DS3sAY3a]
MSLSKITTCLWFDDASQTEDAAKTYTDLFPNSKITKRTEYSDANSSISGHKPGDLLTLDLTLNGHSFSLLNGGPEPGFKHSMAVSFMIECKDQEEVDHYWNGLAKDGPKQNQVCGWLTDKWGISWQIIPKQLIEWLDDEDKQKAERVTTAMLNMGKMDIEGLKKAHEGAA